MINRFYFQFFLLIILIIGASRFIYSTSLKENISLFNKSYAEKAIFRSIEKNEQGERLSAAAAAGKASIDQVVIAVAEAETTLVNDTFVYPLIEVAIVKEDAPLA